MLLPAVGLLTLGAGGFALALRRTAVPTLLAFYLFATAEVVLIAEVLSPFHAIRLRPYLALLLFTAFAGLATWIGRGRPLPACPRVSASLIRRHPIVAALALAVAAALCFEAFVALTAVPNNWDGLAYHLSRAAAWMQHGSLGRFETHTERENIFPPNAELQVLFTFLFSHSDRFAALPQFLAQLALLAGIFGTACRLGFGRAEAAFGALLFATLSEVALQATSVQNDLVATAFVVVAVYFVLGRTRVDLLLASLALGLAVGTKLTALYALPIVALLALATLSRRQLAQLVVGAAISSAALGGYVYATNTIKDGSPLGAASVRQPFSPDVTATGTISTFTRLLFRFVDISGFRPDYRVADLIRNGGEAVFGALHIATNPPEATHVGFTFSPEVAANEDNSYFGPLGFLVVLPLSLGYLGARILRRGSPVTTALALAVPLFALEFALTYRYNPWIGRFMVLPVALTAVLASRVYAARLLSATIAGVGVVFLAAALLHNEYHPVGRDGAATYWSLTRTEGQTVNAPWLQETLATVEHVVPERATIGYLIADGDFDYPLYGRHFTRNLVALPSDHPVQTAKRLGLRWVLTGTPVQLPKGWTGVAFPQSHLALLTQTQTPGARRFVDYIRSTPIRWEYSLRPRRLISALPTPAGAT